MFFGFGYPATKAFGYGKAVPAYGKAVAPWGYGAFAKPFYGKPFYGKPFYGKPFYGKPFYGKPFGKFGAPATKAGGYGAVVPATTVATTPAVI